MRTSGTAGGRAQGQGVPGCPGCRQRCTRPRVVPVPSLTRLRHSILLRGCQAFRANRAGAHSAVASLRKQEPLKPRRGGGGAWGRSQGETVPRAAAEMPMTLSVREPHSVSPASRRAQLSPQRLAADNASGKNHGQHVAGNGLKLAPAEAMELPQRPQGQHELLAFPTSQVPQSEYLC